MLLRNGEWPVDLPPTVVCFTVDVEWACGPVLADLVALFDEHHVKGTFFITHKDVAVPGHERGLHPNFRRNGETYRRIARAAELSDEEVHERVVAATHAFAPEATGLRTHSLRYDSTLLPIYRRHGLQYDCSYRMPLVAGLTPFWQQHDMLEIPTFYADYFDLVTGATGFDVDSLQLDCPGIKVLDFHPNMVFVNAIDVARYDATKAFYHDPDRLLRAREAGRGTRTMLVDVLERVNRQGIAVMTLDEINRSWRTRPRPWRDRVS